MCCIAAAVMFLLDDVDDVLLFFLSQMEILCNEEIEFSYALRFVCITPSSILHKTVLDIK